MPINPKTWRELLDAVYEINSAKNHTDFAAAAVTAMLRLVETEIAVFQVLDRDAQRIVTRMAPADPFTPGEVAYYTAHSDEMPMVPYFARTGDTRARRMSDIVDPAVWLASDYYRICLARLDLPHCLALPITITESTVAALSFNRRGADFTPHDCELLDAFAPHFRLSWERHENPWAEQRQLDAQQRLRALGLSAREAEVLYWITEGKQNREIASILGIQLGTVQEHVAAILSKIGQENRHAASIHALGVLKRR